MNDVAAILRAAQGKPLKSVREDAKLGTLTLEFEDNATNQRVVLSTKGIFFVSSTIAAVKKTKPSLKAKEAALEPVAAKTAKKSKNKKPANDKAGGLTL